MDSTIKTRLLIISDTHGMEFNFANRPLNCADVAIHCGDLTDGSQLEEFCTATRLLKEIQAPLKLVIAGNHDFTPDIPASEKKVAEATPPLDPALVAREYGTLGEARQLFTDAKAVGILLLDEGTHSFVLENGALLTVYGSPYTPAFGEWGFQYHPDRGHDYLIGEDADVAITHGPSKGIMDYTHGRERAGCPQLFAAVARARPRVHCFGHIHEGWGATLVSWRDDYGEEPNHFTAIDNDKSYVVEKLANLTPSRSDTEEELGQKRGKLARYDKDRCCMTSHCREDEYPIEKGKQTLFVNASAAGIEQRLTQKPWFIDIELGRAP